MEKDPNLSYQPGHEDSASKHADEPASSTIAPVPPKPGPEDKKGNVWIRSLTSFALYLLVGYYFFRANWTLLLILTAIVIFHELGHFIAMKLYHYQDLGIFFIPLLGAYASGTKREVSQKQSAIILLMGPMPGILVGLLLYFISQDELISGLPYSTLSLFKTTAVLMIFLNLLNLLPIYPLDGGQLLNRLFLDEKNIIGKIFVILSALALAYFAISLPAYPLLIFPAMMLLRLRNDSRYDQLTKRIEENGINLEKTYEELTDEEYWAIRKILIENDYPGLKNLRSDEYSANEDKVVSAIESLLQRTIVQDLSWLGKLVIILLWTGSFAIPFLLYMDLPFFHRSF